MKIGVVGSNSILDIAKVFTTINKVVNESSTPPVILGGGGKGVASLVKDYCNDYNLDFVEFQPYYFLDKTAEFSNKYFFIRTRQIVDNADKLLFITNGDCKEVNYGIKYTQKLNKPYNVLIIPKN
jgi:hypothetical protein